MEAESRRANRAQARQRAHYLRGQREEERARIQEEKELARIHAADEAEQYQFYVESLVRTHTRVSAAISWEATAQDPAPYPPSLIWERTERMQSKIAAYKPSFFARLFGREGVQRAELDRELEYARTSDQRHYQEALATHAEQMKRWEHDRTLAAKVVARDASVYGAALQATGVLGVLSEHQVSLELSDVEADGVVLRCRLLDDEPVPVNEIKLTSTGKRQEKALPSGRYWALYQDHICSVAIRAGREILATLPVGRVIVNVAVVQRCPQSGHVRDFVYLGVQFSRATEGRIKWESVDPSESLKNFPHRMSFKKTTGFIEVEPLELSEQWVETA